MDLGTALSVITAVATIATAVAVIATFFVYRRQAEVMEAQLVVAKEQIRDLQESRAGQQLYQVITQLLDIRDEVETVLTLRHKPLDQWSQQELEAAHVVSSRFHVVGLLVTEGIVPEGLFAKAWFYSVPNCHEILLPFLVSIRAERDPRYWGGFDVLKSRVAEHAATFHGFK